MEAGKRGTSGLDRSKCGNNYRRFGSRCIRLSAANCGVRIPKCVPDTVAMRPVVAAGIPVVGARWGVAVQVYSPAAYPDPVFVAVERSVVSACPDSVALASALAGCPDAASVAAELAVCPDSVALASEPARRSDSVSAAAELPASCSGPFVVACPSVYRARTACLVYRAYRLAAPAWRNKK